MCSPWERDICVYLFMYLLILHVVTDESSDPTVIFKVNQGGLRRKVSLLISVPSSSSRLRNPSVVERRESFVWCAVDALRFIWERVCCCHFSLQ